MPHHDLVPDFLERQLARLRDFLDGADHVGEAGPQTVSRTRAAVDNALANAPLPPPGDHYSRSPVVSLVQSALAERQAVREAPEDEDDDGGPVEGIAGSILARVLEGAHDFCDTPAARAMSRMVGTWVGGRGFAGRSASRDVSMPPVPSDPIGASVALGMHAYDVSGQRIGWIGHRAPGGPDALPPREPTRPARCT